MKRPPARRYASGKPRRDGINRRRKTTAGAEPAPGEQADEPAAGPRQGKMNKRRRNLLLAVALLLGFSGLQYLQTGGVSWPGTLFRNAAETLRDYATRPDAGWRRAAATLEELGTTREGKPAPAFDLTGRVVRIADGDTVSILDHSNRQHKVRLFGIDSPERDQPYGKAARSALARLVDEKPVGVVVVTTDSYGREVGTLYQAGVNINAAMVASGYAWWYQHYAPYERKLALSEQQARAQRRGLWADPHPVPPWDWRHGQR
ncbi:MAG: thermonuclease family protein [Halioglobus sp.]